ncbi:MAG: hypothetical protein ACRD50_12215 [Candidatus Acidiferrales bacterium]
MSLFDLLFILSFLASVATLITAAVCAICKRGPRALRILRAYAICLGIYLGIVAIASLFVPRRVLRVGEPECFDDWCISVESFSSTPRQNGVSNVVRFQLSSRAGRVTQREKNVVVYLTDNHGRRFDPALDSSAVPFDAQLQPQQSIATTRVFEVPADTSGLGLVIAHEGGFPIGWFIIGDEAWFRKPAIVPLR